jgi:prevent-host-death family protein
MPTEMTTMPASAARDAFAEVTGRVQHGRERIALTKHGKKVAALVTIEDAEFLEALEDRLDLEEALERLREYERTGESCSWEQVKAEIEQDLAASEP